MIFRTLWFFNDDLFESNFVMILQVFKREIILIKILIFIYMYRIYVFADI